MGKLSDSLVSYWKLQEASGTRSDSVGSNDLADNNTVTSAVGKLNTAAQFTRANSEYLSLSDNASISMGDIDFTFACWVYLDSISGGNHTLLSKWESGTSKEYSLDRKNFTNRFRFIVTNDGSTNAEIEATSFGAPTTGSWCFIVSWHDATANTINIQIDNGAVDSLAHSTGVHDGAADFSFGSVNIATTPTSFMDGRIDEVSVWKRVLTGAERGVLYKNGDGNFYDNINANEYDFEVSDALFLLGGL